MKTKICMIAVLIMALVGCATVANLQTAWNKLTPNDKARIVVGGFQDQLNNLFALGKSYVASHPEKATEWKTKVIPAFDTANKSLRGYIVAIGMGTATPEAVFKEIPPLIVSVVTLLQAMGVIGIGGAK
jgi:ABC-type Fe3+-hydroxamate transport system substrate-binding protein